MRRIKVSEKYSLCKEDLLKILKGAGIATSGAVITYIISVLPQIDLGNAWWSPIAVAISSIIVNGIRKWICETTYK